MGSPIKLASWGAVALIHRANILPLSRLAVGYSHLFILLFSMHAEYLCSTIGCLVLGANSPSPLLPAKGAHPHYVTLPALRAHNLGAADLQGTANLNPSLCSLPRMAFGHSLSATGFALAVPSARIPRL